MAENKMVISPENRAKILGEAKKHWRGGSTTFGQLECAKTKIGLLKTIEGFEDWYSSLEPADRKLVSALMYVGSNANAINNALHGRGSKAGQLLDELEIE